jgi:hypothetical protein
MTTMLALAAWAPGQTAPAAAPAPASLANYVPGKGLAVLVESPGLASQAAAWRNTAAYKILNNTSTGAMLEDAIAQAVDKAPGDASKSALTGADVVALLKHVAQNGFILGMASREDTPAKAHTVFVLKNAARKDVRPLTGKLLGARMGRDAKTQGVTKGSRKIVIVTPAPPAAPPAAAVPVPGGAAPPALPPTLVATAPAPWAWWTEKDDLVILPQAEDVDAILAVLDGKQPSAADSPIRAELLKADGAFQPVVAGFLDPSALPRTGPNPPAQAFEKAGVRRADLRWGFEGPALMTSLRLAAPAPRKFPLTLVDQPTFDLATIPPIPDSVSDFLVFSLDLAKIYDQILAAAKQASPDAAAKVEAFEKQFQDHTKRRLRQDILAQLGPRAAYYTLPAKARPGGLAGMVGMLTPFQLPRFVVEIDLKDAEKFRPMLDELMVALNKELENQFGGAADDAEPAKKADTKKAQPPAPPRFQMVPTNPPKYILRLPPQYAAMTNLSLTIALGKKHLFVSSAADAANEALALETKTEGIWKPKAEQAQVLARLPKGLTFLQISDPSPTLPEALAALPMTLQATLSSLSAGGGPAPGLMPPGTGPQPGAPTTSSSSSGTDSSSAYHGPPYPGSSSTSGGSSSSSGSSSSGGPVPGASGGPRGVIQVDPAKLPKPDEIRPLLFPGSTALAVDAQGVQFVRREAFPSVGSPGAAGMMSGVLGPALQAARDAARRAAGGGGLPAPGATLPAPTSPRP